MGLAGLAIEEDCLMPFALPRHLHLWLAGVLTLLLGAGCNLISGTPTTTPTATAAPTITPLPSPTPVWVRPGWDLAWHDEFEGSTLDEANWTFDIGGHGWGNGELQVYTKRPENVRLENGHLVIEARKEDFLDREYTSARMKTQGLQTWQYGRIEARMKIPRGQGIWPAFWMLGNNIQTTPWPACGEIDVMENIGKEPATIHGTVHGPGYSGSHGVGGPDTLSSGAFADDYHVYAIEWDADQIKWFVDDTAYFTVTAKDLPGEWVYDHPFFIILNVAVGGGWPGYPDDTTSFPQFMYVDYVRVYHRSP
jgi:beta-glucanase (GH16 family)